ncbi:hypothetical protein TNCV_2827321 [Trichonephila clavipes]|nr:hypothetical protein TNCV_2827321 [Trichonephila clavipes]
MPKTFYKYYEECGSKGSIRYCNLTCRTTLPVGRQATPSGDSSPSAGNPSGDASARVWWLPQSGRGVAESTQIARENPHLLADWVPLTGGPPTEGWPARSRACMSYNSSPSWSPSP